MSLIEQYYDIFGQLEMIKRNGWIENDKIKVYVRRTARYLSGVKTDTLEIGAVEVHKGKDRRKGEFKRFLNRFEEAAFSEERTVYVENVMDKFLQDFLERQGYKRIGEDTDSVCFTKTK